MTIDYWKFYISGYDLPMTGSPRNANKPPIVQYWHSSQIPGEVAELIASFRDHNPDLNHLVFDEAKAEAFIAEHLTAREVAAFRSCAVPAMQADYFRYCAVLTLGGIYSDADFRCRRPLSGLLEKTPCGQVFSGSNGQIINGFFVFPFPGHPLLRLALDVATLNVMERTVERIWKLTGPGIFTGLGILHARESSDAIRLGPCLGLDLPILEAVGGYRRVEEAFDHLRITPIETMSEWIGRPSIQLKYKQDPTHWVSWQSKGRSVFR